MKIDRYINASSKWLDIGCYDGTILRLIDAQEKIGIDLNVKKQRDINIIQATVEYLPFKEQIFEIITAFDILEHIKNDSLMIKQVENKLTSAGSFIITAPHEKERIFPKFLKSWLNFKKWKHIKYGYTQTSLKKLFEGKWRLKFIQWNTDLSNFLYFPLQFIWKILQKFARIIINRLIEIEFIRTEKFTSPTGHIILIARKE